MREPVNLADIERSARRKLPRLVYDFIAGGADDETTVRDNEAAFARYRIVPRNFVGVEKRSSATTVLGDPVAFPVLLGPTGLAKFAHPAGELAAARAARELGTVYVASIAGSYSVEDIAATGSAPRWFQLYLWKDRELVESIVERAQRAGYTTLVLTLDVPVVGHRERDLRNGLSIPPRFPLSRVVDTARHLRWLAGYFGGGALNYANLVGDTSQTSSALSMSEHVNTHLANPGADWEWLSWLRGMWPGRIAVKGVLRPQDAIKAIDCGADGVIVSNHGGRQLDRAPATIEVLGRIVDAVDGRGEVLLDGGVRRGSDVFAALALGAKACLIGRPYWYGLAHAGQAGVQRVLEILRDELDRTQALAGVPDLAALPAADDLLLRTGGR